MPIRVAIFISCLLLLSACTAGGSDKSLSQQNDELRATVLDLTAQLEAARRQAEELRLHVEALVAASQPDAAPSAELIEATPRVTAISIGNKSHAIDEDRDGLADHVVLYIHSEDGLGRFTQLAGEVSILAVLLDHQAGASTIGQVKLSPLQVRESYRSSFAGTHYTIRVPVTLHPHARQAAGRLDATVQAVYRDGATGAELATERSISLRIAPAVHRGGSASSITPNAP